MRFHSTLGVMAAVGLLAATPAAASDAGPAHTLADPVTVSVSPTGLEAIAAVSRTGRFVVGSRTFYGRAALWDLRRDERVKLLPRKAVRPSLSDDGRYVSYALPVGDWGRRKVMVFDRKTERTRNVTRKSSGALLRPSWRNRCTQAKCEEDQKLRDAPQLAGGQISGNGKWVAFCANFGKPSRIDLYVKNLRTQRLRRFKAACRPEIENGDSHIVRAPSVSATARTILLQGRLESSEAGFTWAPGRALFDREELEEIGGVGNTMTRDGRTVSINGAFSGSGYPSGVQWYDVSSGLTVPSDPAGMKLTMGNSSRDGRYVLWRSPDGWQLEIRDRMTGVDYDLQGALAAAGFTPDTRAGSPEDLWGNPNPASAMSGDGAVTFVKTTTEEIVAVRWAP